MSIVSRLDQPLGCTFVVWQGEVTLDEWHATFDSIVTDPKFPPGRKWLADATMANVSRFDLAAVASMTARMNDAAELLGGIRMAVIPSGAWSNTSNFFDREVTIQRLTTMQFTGVDTACVWLGLPVADGHKVVEDLRSRGLDAL
jgi:hypothetical protein